MRLTDHMRLEAGRYRSLADRLEVMAAELEAIDGGDPGIVPTPTRRAAAKTTTAAAPTPDAAGGRFRVKSGRISVRQRTVELMEEEPPRPWTASEVTDELEKRGIPPFKPGDADRTKNVRNAFKASLDAGDVVRTPDGFYVATKFKAIDDTLNGTIPADRLRHLEGGGDAKARLIPDVATG
jgi:hypothetical protein